MCVLIYIGTYLLALVSEQNKLAEPWSWLICLPCRHCAEHTYARTHTHTQTPCRSPCFRKNSWKNASKSVIILLANISFFAGGNLLGLQWRTKCVRTHDSGDGACVDKCVTIGISSIAKKRQQKQLPRSKEGRKEQLSTLSVHPAKKIARTHLSPAQR